MYLYPDYTVSTRPVDSIVSGEYLLGSCPIEMRVRFDH